MVRRFLEEVAFGAATFDDNDLSISTHPEDAIVNRLKAALLELQQRDPVGRWNEFLVPDP